MESEGQGDRPEVEKEQQDDATYYAELWNLSSWNLNLLLFLWYTEYPSGCLQCLTIYLLISLSACAAAQRWSHHEDWGICDTSCGGGVIKIRIIFARKMLFNDCGLLLAWQMPPPSTDGHYIYHWFCDGPPESSEEGIRAHKLNKFVCRSESNLIRSWSGWLNVN